MFHNDYPRHFPDLDTFPRFRDTFPRSIYIFPRFRDTFPNFMEFPKSMDTFPRFKDTSQEMGHQGHVPLSDPFHRTRDYFSVSRKISSDSGTFSQNQRHSQKDFSACREFYIK